MYPFFRMAAELIKARRAPKLGFFDTHVSYHRCWPHDLDIFLEMNNGRILTILDLGRTALALRGGLLDVIRREHWQLTMAGSSVRYRRRIRLFETIRVESRCVGWDDKFMYLLQSAWVGDTCAAEALFRAAVTDRNGLVRADRFVSAVTGEAAQNSENLGSPALPGWVTAWITADGERPWPPEATGVR